MSELQIGSPHAPTPEQAHTPKESERRTALITGAGRGIGRGIALALADAGFDVVIHFHQSATEAETVRQAAERTGVRALTLRADLTDASEAALLVKKTGELMGRLDVLVNNVGNYVHKPLLELETDEWNDMINSNLNATMYTCRTAIPLMRNEGGRIINIGFAGSLNLVARPGIIAYAIAKTGVAMLTKAIAKSEARFGITANIVAPGVIENSVSKPVSEIPAGRLGKIDEVAAAVLYLVSPQAAYVTGTTIEVAGAWNL